jgi:hypothetical protein
MKTKQILCLLVLLFMSFVFGCGSETPEQKLEAFKAAHKAIYDAWQATDTDDLKRRLAQGMIDPLLSEQFKQQSTVLQQRLLQNETHVVESITFNSLEIVQDGKDEFTVAADWTVQGYRQHNDIHPMKVSYQKKFHLVKLDGKWMLDRMME